MKKQFILYALFLFSMSMQAQVSFGKPQKINENWKFILDKDNSDAQNVEFDDKLWNTVDLPHDWSVNAQASPSLASCTGYLPGGIGWYRKKINIPANIGDEKVYLYFEGVYNRSEVYINGQLLGKRPNGYISFMYDATPYIKEGQDNVIAVRVDHSRSADSRWYTGSGIYRDVWLIYANPVHISQWGVYTYPKDVTQKQAALHVEVELENGAQINADLKIECELIAPNGKVAAKYNGKKQISAKKNGKFVFDMKISNPQLWSIDNPRLYTLNAKVLNGGKIIDQSSTKTGFRAFIFDPNKGFSLNGQSMKVKGVCLHHDAGVLGAAVYKEVWKKRLENLKEIGCNAVRTTHNPQAPSLYELCDELGLLVMNEAFDEWEFPKRKWMKGWNRETPEFQGNTEFFDEWAEKDLGDMVRRDRNHVSIFTWSIGNEVDYPNDPYSHPVLGGGETGFAQASFGGYKKDAPDAMCLGEIAKKLVKVVKSYDTSRPITAGLAGVAMSNETECPGSLDITGYNYTEDRYHIDHKKYPTRVIFGSENRHELKPWKATRDNEHVFGQFLWTGIDYLGESGKWPSRGFYCGLLNFSGDIKPRGYFRQSLWSDQPMAYLGTYTTPAKGGECSMKDVWSRLDAENEGVNYEEKSPSIDASPVWNYQEGQSIRVVCYTNAAKAQLLLNGKVVGETKNYDDNTGVIYWDIPFQSGKLEVIGFDKDGKEVSGYDIQSSKHPYALIADQNDITATTDKTLIPVVIDIVDEKGLPVRIADNEITCNINGPVKLIGMEASNNADMSDYTDNKHRAFEGKILVYLQSTGKAGKANVSFTSPWLKSVEVSVDVK